MGPLFGLASAFSWGAGDFCGGLASRFSSVMAALLASQSIGFLATAVILASTNEALPPTDVLLWAAAGGFSGVVGVGAFYLALSRGTMGLIAPLAALIGAALPAVVAIAAGEQVTPIRLAGILAGLVAVVLISLPSGSQSESERRTVRIDLRDLPLVVVSGLGFAGFYLFLDRAATEGGQTWWPLLAVRFVGLLLVGLTALVLVVRAGDEPVVVRIGQLVGMPRRRALSVGLLSLAPLLLIAGLGDLGGNVFFLLANELDALPVAVVLSSLYPVVTTILAAVFLRERLGAVQLAGIGLAVLAVALIGR